MNIEKPICPACNNKGKITAIYKKLNKMGDLLKCERCGLHFIYSELLLSENTEIYTKEYHNPRSIKNLGYEELDRLKQTAAEALLDVVAKYRKEGSLLDIGCGLGHLLEVAERRGWDSYGVEISEYAVNEARKRIDADRLMIGNFMNLSLPKHRFDVIVMVDFVEHIYDTAKVFRRCKESLKHKGLLVIVTPAIDSLSQKCLRKYWPHFNEEHFIFFTKRSVSKILDINDFRLLEISNFKKAFNFYYLRTQIRTRCRIFLIFLVEIVNILIPPAIKRISFFLPHGEMLILAEKN